ncbi:hypothetical protein C8J57DRAFT_1244605 [Mycena rebaudengoi]|nr:hypothetical protein C8J57DRAFT_1244605 [Mycena rebaudengoi]
MHPLLNLRNLLKLPPPLRICATRVRTTVSDKNIQAYLKVFLGLNLSQKRLFLPVFFAHLAILEDHYNIITAVDDDRLVTPQFLAGNMALRGVRFLLDGGLLDVDICCTLWPRLFAWFEILERHARLHPQDDPMLDVDLRLMVLSFIPTLLRYPAVKALADDTPGYLRLLTVAWRVLLDHPTHRIEHKRTMGQLLGVFMDVSRKCNLDEVISAAGGSLGDLADLLIRSLGVASRLITSPRSFAENLATEEFDRWLVDGILGFVHQSLRCYSLLRGTLLEAGYMEALIIDVVASVPCSPGRVLNSQMLSYEFIEESLILARDPDLVCTAIKGQLLMAILMPASRGLGARGGFRDKIVSDILPGYLVYYSVLDAVEDNLDSTTEDLLHNALDSPHVRDAPLGKFWHSWRRLAAERMELVRNWEDEGYIYLATCDNVKDHRKCFKKCSRCECTVYCSRSCQRQDWQDGHRQNCSSFRDIEPEKPIWKYNLVFLRVLVQQDRESFLRSAPEVDHSAVYMEFDYRHDSARITTCPIEEYAVPADSFAQLQWQDLRARIARSTVEKKMGIDVNVAPHSEISQLEFNLPEFYVGVDGITRAKFVYQPRDRIFAMEGLDERNGCFRWWLLPRFFQDVDVRRIRGVLRAVVEEEVEIAGKKKRECGGTPR